ncbi:MAG: MFS transporter [Promethearchaeota archaeon]
MTRFEDIRDTESSKKKYLIFASPRFGVNITATIVDFALLTLYSIGFNLPAWQVLLAIAIGKLSIAASQFLLGWISDAKYTRWGRRKPYILVFSPLFGISFIFLLLPNLFIDSSDLTSLFIWFLIWNIAYQVSYGVTSPYESWVAEQFNLSERPTVSQYMNIFNYIGVGIATVFTFTLLKSFKDQIETNPDIVPTEFLITILSFGAILIILFYLIVFFFPTEPHYEIKSSLMENLKEIVKNKNYIMVNLMQGIASIGIAIVAPTILAFIEAILDFDTTEYIIGAAVLVLSILIFLYIWKKQIEKRGKKKTLLIIFLFAAVILPFSLVGLIPMQNTLIYGIIFLIGVALSLGGWYLFPYIMYADLAEDSEKKTGELKAGIYKGFSSILLNIFQALGLGFSSGITYLIGDDLFYVWWGPLVALILLFSYFFTKKYITLDFEWEEKQRK